jgi:Na+-translocating ferredoxin:NAD+ oxidoreductase RnfG subunit
VQLIGPIRLSGNMEAVTVAIIAAVGGVIAALIQKGRAENKADHNVVANMLVTVKDDIINLHHKIDHVDEQVDKVDDKLDGHIDWHMKKIEKEKSNKNKGE